MEVLKPCPFCGSHPKTVVSNLDDCIRVRVACTKCSNVRQEGQVTDLCSFGEMVETMRMVTRVWNRRAE